MHTTEQHAGGNRTSFRTRLALGSAIAALAFSYGGRAAQAGACINTGVGTYNCSGALNAGTDATNGGLANPLNPAGAVSVTTSSGFGIETSVDSAFHLLGVGGAVFTDNNNSVITGFGRGIRIRNNTSGDNSVNVTGQVTGNTADGIIATNQTGTANVTVSANIVSGNINGINSDNNGTGTTSITTTGAVTGTTANGIYANNAATATDIAITADDVTGATRGIHAVNSGTGSTTVSVSGSVTGATDDGIFTDTGSGSAASITLQTGAAVNGSGAAIRDSGGNATVTVNDGAGFTGAINVSGGNDNVVINGSGTSDGSIFGGTGTDSLTFNNATRTVTGNVTGIESVTVNGASDVTFDGNVTTDEIYALNTGTGLLSVTTNGDVTGTTGSGVFAFNGASGSNLSVSAANVTGNDRGIRANNDGTGSLNVTATGTVTGNGNSGISASIGDVTNASALTITANAASGAQRGIFARHDGTGTTTITVNGAISGGSNGGIFTNTSAGNLNTITLNSGASVVTTASDAIGDAGGNATVTVNTGATVTGSINLGGGTDAVNIAGGLVTLSGSSNAETVTVSGGGTLGGTGTLTGDVAVSDGTL